MNRRRFLAWSTSGTLLALAGSAARGEDDEATPAVGCLVDTTRCIGCRQCEEACNRANRLPRPEGSSLRDRAVFRERRRPSAEAFTVVNEYEGAPSLELPSRASSYIKVQCMHCLDPACVSACIVGALSKAPDGAVVYNPEICIGCRYCMVACPFQIPAYEYDAVLAPRVRKCEFCTDHARGTGANPACAQACPMEAIQFGPRERLLEIAHARLEARPARYRPEVYGEHEVGGTSWLYLVGRDPSEIGLLDLPQRAPPRTTEAIQHGIFKYGAAPLAVYGALGALMWSRQRKERAKDEGADSEDAP